ncbi:MAG: hypothetical protein A2158_08065 [Chloroflexi bacterium RBG_13_46_14]|nr:MAG: hypothetical protein A2158_08065 [Chloroflexi bacterium RBG_13_46_14]
MAEEICPVCSYTLESPSCPYENIVGASIYTCPQCGHFILSKYITYEEGFKEFKNLISAWIRKQNKRGNYYPIVGGNGNLEKWFQDLQYMGFPETVNEKLNMLLKTYADMAGDDYNKIIAVENHPELVSDIAAKNLGEINGLNRLLRQLEYIGDAQARDIDRVRLTAKGWFRVEEISISTSTTDSAFIAMWFTPQTNDCREAIKAAVIASGYNPIIVDETEFNDFIMDEVTTLIRQARFLIADLACIPEVSNDSMSLVTGGVRGGVYWEAGMAYGLGRTVILTCKDVESSKNRIHFDLKQYQTILWKEEELNPDIRKDIVHINTPSFTEKLYQRILSTVGRGSYQRPSKT